MKKLLNIALVLVFSFALSSCGNTPPSLEDRISEVQNGEEFVYTYNGIIEPLELDIHQQGTHQIRTDEELVIIQSQLYDLNKYLEKRVIIQGVDAEIIGDAERVLSVTDIELEDGELSGELQEYESRLYGFRFEYPSIWEADLETGGISLSKDGEIWVGIDVYNDKTDLDSFASSKEGNDGTPVTIASQRSLRYIDGSTIKMYVPNPPKKKIYLITFNENKNSVDAEKDYFYEILESFELIYISVQKGEKCGGEEGIQCLENYVCELESGEENAEGTCVSLNSEGSDQNCPFIAPPIDCKDYRISEYSRTGCPSIYKCVENGNDLRSNEAEEKSTELDTDALISTIEKYQDQILSVDDAIVLQYEITETENLVSVVYEIEELKYKKLYSFAPSANEFNFIEKASFEEGDGRDWEMISGENLQSDLNKVVIKAESEDMEREVSGDMRLYENSHKDFSLEYPKNWYYRSFGAINNTRWIVGFSDDEIEVLSDAVITVSILDEEPKSGSEEYFVVRDRDNDSVYVVEGPEELKETIDLMADSIQ
ncbi:hypothetical protein KKA95_04770 [Patescibacteria group bacterium]|nr:hypothetical protein [Patescibacteria group bacterium]